ncbi:hypothetical protein, partial [Brevibacillus laterosporus]|uniref:hypothetical protein n=1 Tax=Brevibacillus laterosporus TaxID=1465 RepID=UPI003D2038E5
INLGQSSLTLGVFLVKRGMNLPVFKKLRARYNKRAEKATNAIIVPGFCKNLVVNPTTANSMITPKTG